jgi:hypothetical protein
MHVGKGEVGKGDRRQLDRQIDGSPLLKVVV